jgi:hypothetical protein
MAFKLSENLSVKKSLEIAVATSSVYRYMFENRKYEYVSRQESKFEWHFMAQLSFHIFNFFFRTTAYQATKAYHNCSSRVPEEVLYLFAVIRNRR